MQTLETTGPKSIDEKLSKSRQGDIAEHFVCYEAARRGAEVFYNIGSVGHADLILKINDQLYEINVRTDSFWNGKWGNYNAGRSHIKYPIWPVCVTPHSDGYIARWPNNRGKSIYKDDDRGVRCPPGLEDFWN